MKTVSNPMMPVQLRGHHFLCILTYRGKGYTERFVARMTALVEAINDGTPVVLMCGPDDICAGLSQKCREDSSHDCLAAEIRELDRLAAIAVGAVLGRDLSIAVPLGRSEIESLRKAYAAGGIRAACQGCSWKHFCDEIVSENFAGTLLAPLA
jgi:uncharacterized protein